MYKLVWDNGQEVISANYETLEDVETQASYDIKRAGGPKLLHIIDQDNVIVKAFSDMGSSGKQYVLPQDELATYAQEYQNAQSSGS